MNESKSGMSELSKSEDLTGARARYRGRGRGGRSRLSLDEVCEVCGLSRKHAFQGAARESAEGRRGRRGRGREDGPEVEKVALEIWKKAEQPCSVRLKAALPEWLGSYEKPPGTLEEALREGAQCECADLGAAPGAPEGGAQGTTLAWAGQSRIKTTDRGALRAVGIGRSWLDGS